MKPPFTRAAGPALTAALLLSGGFLLWGCTTPAVQLCPNTAVLADTASRTVLRGNQPDLSAVLYRVALIGVRQYESATAFSSWFNPTVHSCYFDVKSGLIYSSVDLHFHATRAPAAKDATYTVPYYVALTQGDRIISKRNFTVQFTFPAGSAAADFSDDIDRVQLNLEKGKQPTEYQILVGLQLTPAERDYNQKMGPYVP